MGALGDVAVNVELLPNAGQKLITAVTDATVDAADTFTVDLTKFGCKNVHGVLGSRETTAGSVVVTDQPIVTAVASGVLTITVPSGADNKIRNYLIWAY